METADLAHRLQHRLAIDDQADVKAGPAHVGGELEHPGAEEGDGEEDHGLVEHAREAPREAGRGVPRHAAHSGAGRTKREGEWAGFFTAAGRWRRTAGGS